jgi:hypothetical protein
MGLTSGSARWLMSRATSHAAAAGLRLSGECRARPGHMPAPDPYSCGGPLRPGTLLRPGPYSEGPGAHPRDPACLLWEPRTCTYRGPVSLCGGPDPTTHPGMYYLSLPRGALRPTHVWGWVLFSVWPGGAKRVQRLHTVEEGTPDSGYR